MDEYNQITAEELESDYPSIEPAYKLAIDSYDATLKRLDAMDGKIQNMMAFALTLFLAIPTIGKIKELSFNSYLFIISMALLVISVAVSIYARKTGTVRLIDPSALFNQWLDMPQIEFKKDMIYFAGESFTAMTNLIDRKWQLNLYSLLIFAAALVLAAVWVAGVHFS